MSSRMSSFRSSPIDRRRFMRGAGAGRIGLTAAPALLSGAFAQGRRWSGGDPPLVAPVIENDGNF
jgi:hypothetical protein